MHAYIYIQFLYFETCSDNHLIILCCDNSKAIIKGSVGKGAPLAFITMAYKVANRLFVFGFIVISVVLLISLLLLQFLVSIISIQKPTLLFVQASPSSQSSITSQNNDGDDEADNNLSTYENPTLRFNIKYPTDYRIAEVSNSPAYKTVTFEKLPFTPGTSGAGFLSLTVDKEDKAMTFDKLKKANIR
jgi:hypothetical protein